MEELDIRKEIPILDDNEEVIKAYKPSKKRFVHITLIFSTGFSALLASLFIVLGILGLVGIIDFINDNTGKPDPAGPLFCLIFGSVFLVFLLTNIIWYRMAYKKAYYVLTNKRVIIRHGIIGADYKSLEYRYIDTINVKVNTLDKFVKPNTGTISFGSASSPIINSGENSKDVLAKGYNFAAIENPYDAYKEIKEIVSQYSNK